MADYAISMDFWDRIQPRIRQWEITHGRPMPKQQYQALVEGELGTETKAAEQSFYRGKALDLEQERIDLAKSQAERAESAAKVKGITDLAVAGGTGYLAYKHLGVLEKTAASNEKLISRFLGGSKAPAVDLAGVSAAPGAATPAFELGGQAALAKSAPILQAPTAFPEATAALAELEGGTAAAGAEATATTPAAAGAGFGTTALAGAAGYATGYIASKILGANEDISQGLQLGGTGIGIGLMVGGPVGAVVGGLIGLAGSLFDDVSVICSELLRQGEITLRERTACVIFRYRYISDEMFEAYLVWARPHVTAMRKGGWRNRIRLPFARAFVHYMVKVERRTVPSFFERLVYGYAWGRCRFIAESRANREEVAYGVL